MRILFENLEKRIENDLNKIINTSLKAVDPYACVEKQIHLENNALNVCKEIYDLKKIERIILIGYGKAVMPMAAAVIDRIGSVIEEGIIITKHINRKIKLPSKITVLTGGHPIPSQKSLESTKTLVKFLDSVGEKDLIINLVSGGGSALMSQPSAGISLNDIQLLTSSLLDCGADIQEINTIRKHVDEIKGGGLARLVGNTNVISLIISDVLGDDISMIASGPTYPDHTNFEDAMQVIQKYKLRGLVPKNVVEHLQKGIDEDIPETLKEDDPINKTKIHHVIGSLSTIIHKAAEITRKLGYNTQIIPMDIVGEAREIGKLFGSDLKTLASTESILPRPAILIGGGETTVTIRGTGKGGRNQEIAFGALKVISECNKCVLVTLATDGEDGPTDAAGAYITGETLSRAKKKGLNITDFGNNNDTYSFFKELGNLVICGPTGTNVNDLLFMIAY